MELHSENEHYKLFHWNMLDMLEVIGGGTIDSIVTDPPYELNFMWKWWDNSWIAFQPDTWKKCYDALKPWWYLLAFWGSRTFHRIACAIEDAGFEIRDTIMWLYGSWFPKSLNLWKMIDKKQGNERIKTGRIIHHAQKWVAVAEERGNIWAWAFGEARDEEETIWTSPFEWRGTALKPSFEPVIVARKPLEWSCTDNVIKYGVGGINIDECRVGDSWATKRSWQSEYPKNPDGTEDRSQHRARTWHDIVEVNAGRFPANTILTYDESDFEEVCSGFPDTKSRFEERNDKHDFKGNKEAFTYWYKKRIGSWFNDEWSAARYFYCAKASKRDRDEGLDEMEIKSHAEINGRKEWSAGAERAYWWWTNPYLSVSSPRKNTHPTVKPTDLMQYLVRLVTPNGWTVLDPFNWSWSTWKAVMYENKDRHKNYKYIWIELTDEYLPIAKARIEYVINKVEEKPEWPYEQPLF